MKPKLMSTQQQPHSSHHSKIKRGFVWLALTALMLVTTLSTTVKADSVTHWNKIATDLTTPPITNPPLKNVPSPHQSRIYAMTHAAIHDALNAIDRRYSPYALFGSTDPAASPEAAVAAAAYRVLLNELHDPLQQDQLNNKYQLFLAGIPDGDAKTRGTLIGEAAAAAIIALRSDDGSTAQVPYTPGNEPGDWQLTPGVLTPLAPGWGQVTPFALRTGSQFRPAPSAYFNLTSGAYTRDYDEVKSIGEAASTTRTAEQSDIALFWFESSPPAWNRIVRNVAAEQSLDLWSNARLFALVNLALADGYISAFEAKYTYNFWRPVTAIRAGDTDGNPRTIADPNWTPLRPTPGMPDNSSGHSVAGAAVAQVLTRFFNNDNIPFTTTSASLPEITRSFSSFSEAAQENADSRVYAGIHFRSACRDGLRQGAQVGRYISNHFLKPVRGNND